MLTDVPDLSSAQFILLWVRDRRVTGMVLAERYPNEGTWHRPAVVGAEPAERTLGTEDDS